MWCHMAADTVFELHQMASKLGLKKEWFQNKKTPHYDLSPAMRTKAIKLGAIPVKSILRTMKKRNEE